MYLVWLDSGRHSSMVRDIQILYLDDAVDFVKIAEGMGAKAYRMYNSR